MDGPFSLNEGPQRKSCSPKWKLLAFLVFLGIVTTCFVKLYNKIENVAVTSSVQNTQLRQELNETRQKLMQTEQRLMETQQELNGTKEKLNVAEEKLQETSQRVNVTEKRLEDGEAKHSALVKQVGEDEKAFIDLRSSVASCPLVCSHGTPSPNCSTCRCEEGWTGETCNTPANCPEIPCVKGTINVTSCDCDCFFGSTGVSCEVPDPNVTREDWTKWIQEQHDEDIQRQQEQLAVEKYKPTVGRAIGLEGPVPALLGGLLEFKYDDPTRRSGDFLLPIGPNVRANEQALHHPHYQTIEGDNIQTYSNREDGIMEPLTQGGFILETMEAAKKLGTCGDYIFKFEQQYHAYWEELLPQNGQSGTYDYTLSKGFQRTLDAAGDHADLIVAEYGAFFIVEAKTGGVVASLKGKSARPEDSCGTVSNYCLGGNAVYKCPSTGDEKEKWIQSIPSYSVPLSYRIAPISELIKDLKTKAAIEEAIARRQRDRGATSTCPVCQHGGVCVEPNTECTCPAPWGGASCQACAGKGFGPSCVSVIAIDLSTGGSAASTKQQSLGYSVKDFLCSTGVSGGAGNSKDSTHSNICRLSDNGGVWYGFAQTGGGNHNVNSYCQFQCHRR